MFCFHPVKYFYVWRLVFRHRNLGGIWVYPRNDEAIAARFAEALQIIERLDLSGFVRRSIYGVIFIDPEKQKVDMVYRNARAVIVRDSYAKDYSTLHLASLLMKWAGVIAFRYPYSSPEARKFQLDFLRKVDTGEARELIDFLASQWEIDS